MVKVKNTKSCKPSEIAERYFSLSQCDSNDSDLLGVNSLSQHHVECGKHRSRSRNRRSTPSRSSNKRSFDSTMISNNPASPVSDWSQWADISVRGRSRSTSGGRSRKTKSLRCPSGHRYSSCINHKHNLPGHKSRHVTVKHVQSHDPCCSRVLETGRRLRKSEGWKHPIRSKSRTPWRDSRTKADSSPRTNDPVPAVQKTINFFIRKPDGGNSRKPDGGNSRKPDGGNRINMQSTLPQKIWELLERNICGRLIPQQIPYGGSTGASEQENREEVVVYNNEDFQIVLRRKPGDRSNRKWDVKATCEKISTGSSERSKQRKKTEDEMSTNDSFHEMPWQMPWGQGPYPDNNQMPHTHYTNKQFPDCKTVGTNTSHKVNRKPSFSQNPNTQNMGIMTNTNNPNCGVNPNINQGNNPNTQNMGVMTNTNNPNCGVNPNINQGNNAAGQGQGQAGFPIKIGSFEKIIAPEDNFKVKMFFYTGEPGDPGCQICDNPNNNGNARKTENTNKSEEPRKTENENTEECRKRENENKSEECPYSDSCWNKTKDSCDFEKYLEQESKKKEEKEEAKKKQKEDKKKEKEEKKKKKEEKKKNKESKKGKKDKEKKKEKKGKKEKSPKTKEDKKKDKKGKKEEPQPEGDQVKENEEKPPPPPKEEEEEEEEIKAQYRIKNNSEELYDKKRQQFIVDKDVVFKSIREMAPKTLEKDIVIKSKHPIRKWNNSKSATRITRPPLRENPVCEQKISMKTIKSNPTLSIKQSYSVNCLTDVRRKSIKKQSFSKPKITNIIKKFENKIHKKIVKIAKETVILGSQGDIEKSNLKQIKEEPLVKVRKKIIKESKKGEKTNDMDESRELACIAMTSDKEETVETFNKTISTPHKEQNINRDNKVRSTEEEKKTTQVSILNQVVTKEKKKPVCNSLQSYKSQKTQQNVLGTTEIFDEEPFEGEMEDHKIPLEINEIIKDFNENKMNTKQVEHNEKLKRTTAKQTTKNQLTVLSFDILHNQRYEKEHETSQRKDVGKMSLKSFLGLKNTSIEPKDIEYIKKIIAFIDKPHVPNTYQYKESLDDIIITDIEDNEYEQIASTPSQNNEGKDVDEHKARTPSQKNKAKDEDEHKASTPSQKNKAKDNVDEHMASIQHIASTPSQKNKAKDNVDEHIASIPRRKNEVKDSVDEHIASTLSQKNKAKDNVDEHIASTPSQNNEGKDNEDEHIASTPKSTEHIASTQHTASTPRQKNEAKDVDEHKASTPRQKNKAKDNEDEHIASSLSQKNNAKYEDEHIASTLSQKNKAKDNEDEHIGSTEHIASTQHTASTLSQNNEGSDEDEQIASTQHIASTLSRNNEADNSNQIVGKQTREIENRSVPEEETKAVANKKETISPIMLREAYAFRIGKKLSENQTLDRRQGIVYDINYNKANISLPLGNKTVQQRTTYDMNSNERNMILAPKHDSQIGKVNMMKGINNGKNDVVKISKETEEDNIIPEEMKNENIVLKLRSKFEC